jgi:hypothetical protein
MNCETCRFWDRLHADYGDCRRHAPRPILEGDTHKWWKYGDTEPRDYATIWPTAGRLEWCGEHQPKEPAP